DEQGRGQRVAEQALDVVGPHVEDLERAPGALGARQRRDVLVVQAGGGVADGEVGAVGGGGVRCGGRAGRAGGGGVVAHRDLSGAGGSDVGAGGVALGQVVGGQPGVRAAMRV